MLEMQNVEAVEALLQKSPCCLLDFWADWCGTCRMMSDVLQELEDANTGRVVFVKINADTAADVAVKYEVSTLPTFLLFANGKLCQRITGARSKAFLQKALDALID